VIIKKIKSMVMVFLYGLQEILIKANIKMTNVRGKERWDGQTEVAILEIGLEVFSMVMGKLSIQMEQLKKVILKIISILDLFLEVNT